MIRRILLYLSNAGWARAIFPRFFLARRVALRFVAGETLTDALRVTQELNTQGLLVTLDYLGESVTRAEDTEEVVRMYQDTLRAIKAQGLQASVSLKLTHLGLDISEELCLVNLRHILTIAHENGNIPVTIDMESSAYTDVTLRLYRTLRDEYSFDNIGTVIQAYLYRSADDMAALTQENAHIRLCKGAYLESAEVAFPLKANVDQNFVQIVTDYLQAPTQSYLCIATHDENMIAQALSAIERHAITAERYEFQMLYGIRAGRQRELVAQGAKMRVYVPFGEAWYPYFMRRLAERPANLWFFAKSLFSR